MYQKYNNEYQNIKRSMVVLSLSLVLVYIVLYYAKKDLWIKDINVFMPNTGNVVISELNIEEYDKSENDLNLLTGNLEFEGKDIDTNEIGTESELDNENNAGNDHNNTEESSIVGDDAKLLSGTKTYYGELDFVETLGISYDYVLKDDKNIYYLNMGEYDYDFSDIARKLKGSLYVMNTEQELIANSMFGDKVTYINIPEYKNQKVLILLEVNNQSWLLAIDYAIYHQVKPYLKTLFID